MYLQETISAWLRIVSFFRVFFFSWVNRGHHSSLRSKASDHMKDELHEVSAVSSSYANLSDAHHKDHQGRTAVCSFFILRYTIKAFGGSQSCADVYVG